MRTAALKNHLLQSVIAIGLLATASTWVAAAGEPTPACKKCMVSANDDRKACLKTRGAQDKALCNNAMGEQVKRCQAVCNKPDAKP